MGKPVSVTSLAPAAVEMSTMPADEDELDIDASSDVSGMGSDDADDVDDDSGSEGRSSGRSSGGSGSGDDSDDADDAAKEKEKDIDMNDSVSASSSSSSSSSSVSGSGSSSGESLEPSEVLIKATMLFTGVSKEDLASNKAQKALTDAAAAEVADDEELVTIESMSEAARRRRRRLHTAAAANKEVRVFFVIRDSGDHADKSTAALKGAAAGGAIATQAAVGLKAATGKTFVLTATVTATAVTTVGPVVAQNGTIATAANATGGGDDFEGLGATVTSVLIHGSIVLHGQSPDTLSDDRLASEAALRHSLARLLMASPASVGIKTITPFVNKSSATAAVANDTKVTFNIRFPDPQEAAVATRIMLELNTANGGGNLFVDMLRAEGLPRVKGVHVGLSESVGDEGRAPVPVDEVRGSVC